MNREAVAGVVVVTGLVLSILGLLGYAVWDLFRQLHGDSISVTASAWLLRFFMRHPIAALLLGMAAGILAGHFMWPQIAKGP